MKKYLMLILICMSFLATAQSNSGYAYFIGDKFHGLKMANGERYDKNALIAGHPYLEYGTKIRVTNTNNAKSVIVTITDKGPFKKGGVVELSHKAGETIGMVYDKMAISKVKAPVRIEVVGVGETVIAGDEKPESRSTTPSTYDENSTKGNEKTTPETKTKPAKPKVTTATKTTTKPKVAKTAAPTNENTGVYKIEVQSVKKAGYGVQIGVFNDIDAVLYKVKQLNNKGFTDIYYTKSGDGYKMILKNYANYDQANAYKKALKAKYGISGFVVEFNSF